MVNRAIIALTAALCAPVVLFGDPPVPAEALVHRASLSKVHASEPAAHSTLTIPAHTEAAVQLLSGIHTRVSHVGDPVTARLLQPIMINGQVALPSGSLINGEITRVRSAGRMRRPGELAVRFEQVVLPDGQDQPILAALSGIDNSARLKTYVDSEGHLKGTKGLSWKGLAGGFIGLGGLTALHVEIAGAAALGSTLPLGGGAVIGCALLLPHGNDVHVPPETRLRIRLDHPLTVRVMW